MQVYLLKHWNFILFIYLFLNRLSIDLLWEYTIQEQHLAKSCWEKWKITISYSVILFIGLVYFVALKTSSGKWSQREFCHDSCLLICLTPLHAVRKIKPRLCFLSLWCGQPGMLGHLKMALWILCLTPLFFWGWGEKHVTESWKHWKNTRNHWDLISFVQVLANHFAFLVLSALADDNICPTPACQLEGLIPWMVSGWIPHLHPLLSSGQGAGWRVRPVSHVGIP